jgi:hypothetical protein
VSGVVFVELAAVLDAPAPHVLGAPHLAHDESGYWRGEVVAAGQLEDPLAADAEQLADLGGAYEVIHGPIIDTCLLVPID